MLYVIQPLALLCPVSIMSMLMLTEQLTAAIGMTRNMNVGGQAETRNCHYENNHKAKETSRDTEQIKWKYKGRGSMKEGEEESNEEGKAVTALRSLRCLTG